jgi:hypothetical protein
MSGDDFIASDDPGAQARDAALDGALARALTPPAPTPGFQLRLQAALVRERASTGSRAASRMHAEREQREQLAELQAGYLRLRRRTLGTLIGGAFAAGAAVAVVFPWLQAGFGAHAIYVLASAGALLGIGIGTASWIGRVRIPNPFERL